MSLKKYQSDRFLAVERRLTWTTPIVIAIITYFIFVPMEKNSDKLGYLITYESNWDRFEPLFSLSQQAFFLGGFEFETYWLFLLFIQSALIAYNYSSRGPFLLAIIPFFYFNDYFFGTQVRYALASLFILSAVLSEKRSTDGMLSLLAVLTHYGAVVILLLRLATFAYGSADPRKRLRILLFGAAVGATLSPFISDIVAAISSATRFSYFLDSEFYDTKSSMSLIYTALMMITALIGNVFILKLGLDSPPVREILRLYVLIMATVFYLSAFAVISGRLLNFSFLLEPFVIFYFFRSNNGICMICGTVMFTVSVSKVLALVF